MNYYEYEMLANLKKQEIERIAQESWKFTTLKHESNLKRTVKKLVEFFAKKEQQSKDNCCCCLAH